MSGAARPAAKAAPDTAVPPAGRVDAAATRRNANRAAVARIAACRPAIVEAVTAREALGLDTGELGHAGPPFESGSPPSPVVLEALAGAVVHEGWAGSIDAARAMVLDGRIRLRCNHALGVVSPMSGVVRPSQRLFRVVDLESGAACFATLAEKGRRVLRFGHYDAEVADGLRFVEHTVADALARALPAGGLEVLPLLARAIELGDDVHQRNVAGMLGFLASLGPLDAVVRDWLAGNPQHALNYAMASAKLCLDRARGVAGSSVVTALTRNGVDCAIQVAGTGDRWFRAPADLPRGGLFEGFTPMHVHPDMGDSAIMEAFGLGGCIAHASPEIARTMQRDWSEATADGRRMRTLFVDRHPLLAPALCGAEGVGLGLDAASAAVSERGVRIHTGIAHVDGRTGWVGIGVAYAPRACFEAAVAALDAGGPFVDDAGSGRREAA